MEIGIMTTKIIDLKILVGMKNSDKLSLKKVLKRLKKSKKSNKKRVKLDCSSFQFG